ncbi:hypothetical protein GCM10009798_26900 [Nocardioides panacihumi]|uniref:Sigma-70 family RNA polymerase sigma factor n=1 Tax=Nocardioides panacihumi TaxID=400774 RepID=A0ABP5CMQ2_9ACTN
MHDPAPTDSDLLLRARDGNADAYAELYRRHHGTVLAIALQTVGPRYAEDLAAEAFTRTLRLIREGAGPTGPVRPYLVAAVRNGRISDQRTNRRVSPVADIRDVADDHSRVPQPETPDRLDSMLVRDAFRTLPPRWRAVLWLGLVEGRPATEVAELLGVSPDAATQLSSRAREALRVAYLEQHLTAPGPAACDSIRSELAKHVRGTSTRRRQRVAKHVGECESCRTATTELAAVGASLHRPVELERLIA